MNLADKVMALEKQVAALKRTHKNERLQRRAAECKVVAVESELRELRIYTSQIEDQIEDMTEAPTVPPAAIKAARDGE